MARLVRDTNLMTREARSRLEPRKKPYYRALDKGRHLGYYRGARGGTWLARLFVGAGTYAERKLGAADDVHDEDGAQTLSFSQAQRAAQAWFAEMARRAHEGVEAAPYPVREALADYLRAYKRRGGRAVDRTAYAINAHILPNLGDVHLADLTRRRLEAWRDALAESAARIRTKMGQAQAHRKPTTDPDAGRRRQATANKVLAILKAALNLAYEHRRITDRSAWEAVKPFRNASAPTVRFLSDAEVVRLVNTCPPDLRAIVAAALLSGCRYGELAAMRGRDFSAEGSTLHIPRSKSGKARHVHLTAEGVEHFRGLVAGLGSADLIFRRAGGEAWGHTHQQRPLAKACARVAIAPAIGFHILRHTYASRLAMRGVPLQVIAAQLGHADTRITSMHYAHLAPSYVAESVRAAFGDLGIAAPSNVATLAARADANP